MTHYTDRPEWAAFLQEIIARPGDDLPRLVLCDWLDELGEEGAALRAEFIRVQVELAKVQAAEAADPGDALCKAFVFKAMGGASLSRRQDQLWAMPEAWKIYQPHIPGIATYGLKPPDRPREHPHFVIRRGFVSEIRCSLADWCGGECDACRTTGYAGFPERDQCPACGGTGHTTGIGPAVVRSHPVQVVTIADGLVRVPTFGGSLRYVLPGGPVSPDVADGAVWLPFGGNWPPGFNHDRFYPTEAEARRYISEFLIAWAKSQSFDSRAYHPHPSPGPLMASTLP